jgi:hypothetical protein
MSTLDRPMSSIGNPGLQWYRRRPIAHREASAYALPDRHGLVGAAQVWRSRIRKHSFDPWQQLWRTSNEY